MVRTYKFVGKVPNSPFSEGGTCSTVVTSNLIPTTIRATVTLNAAEENYADQYDNCFAQWGYVLESVS